jgi:hypothetical protein
MVPSLTVTVAVPVVTVVGVLLVFQYAFGADVISFGAAGAEPPAPVIPPAPVVPALPPAPVELSTQALPAQCWLPVHACPQLPQSVLLLVVSTHAVPHRVCPTAQPDMQALLLQTWVPVHIVAQFPQWVASEVTQAPLHSSSPGWHLHCPA